MHRPTPEERFDRMRREFAEQSDSPLLDQPLTTWVRSTDRHLPRAFLPRPLRQVLAFSFQQLTDTPGIGSRRIDKLLDVLERAREDLATPPAADRQSLPGENGVPPIPPAPLDPEAVTESVWDAWCRAISTHRLEHEPLGRFAQSLGDLPQGLWTVSLAEYASKRLHELSSLPGHGPSRITQVLDVFARVAFSIAGTPANTPLAHRLVPPPVRDAALWTEEVLRRGVVPSLAAIRDGFLRPLFTLLETDLGSETASMVRRRLGLDGPAETLEQIADDVGVTRERVRQLTAKAALVVQVRWPDGRYLLDNLYALFQASPGPEGQLDLLHSVLDACFALEFSRSASRSDVLEAFDRAGRAKRTPLSEAEVRVWAAEEFTDLSGEVVRRWLEEEGLRHVDAVRGALYFSNDPLDQLLRHLHSHPDPLPIGETQDFIQGDERNIRLRLERDPRFIEDELKRVALAEEFSVFRRDGRWSVRLEPVTSAEVPARTGAIAVSDLIHLVVGGLVQAGVCDATVWGVHRFTDSLLRRVFGAALPAAVTPFILASTMTRHSDGLVRHMRRRRLRWDSADASIPVRGKRGWVDHLATQAGVPMTLEELDTALRGSFQDYESYVLQQLNLDEEEEGAGNYGCRFVSGVSHVVPGILIPRAWELDLARQNVSEGIRLLVAKIISMSTRAPFPKEYLRRLPWLVRLCEHSAYGNMRWKEPSAEAELPAEEPENREPAAPAVPPPTAERPESGAKLVEDLLSRFM